jgi:hypothetical protein
MSPRLLPRAAIVLGIATIVGVAAGAAQTEACAYVRCALRIEDHGIGRTPRLVQGVEARTVAKIGLFAPRIPRFETSRDSVQVPYQAFRQHLNSSGVLLIVGSAVALSSAIFMKQTVHGHPGAFIGLLSVGTGISVAGIAVRAGGKHDLERAVSRYNDALPNAP